MLHYMSVPNLTHLSVTMLLTYCNFQRLILPAAFGLDGLSRIFVVVRVDCNKKSYVQTLSKFKIEGVT